MEGEQILTLIGILMIFIGFILVFISSIYSFKGKTEVAVGGFIGPIPFGFATNPKLLKFLIIIIIIFFILTLLFPILFRKL